MVNGKLEYLHQQFVNLEKADYHKMQEDLCEEKVRLWVQQHTALTIDTAMYFNSLKGPRKSGTLQDLTIHTWPCVQVNMFRIAEELDQNNCTKNTKIVFKTDDSDVRRTGYVNRLTGVIHGESGPAIPCNNKGHILSIGRSMMLRYNRTSMMLRYNRTSVSIGRSMMLRYNRTSQDLELRETESL